LNRAAILQTLRTLVTDQQKARPRAAQPGETLMDRGKTMTGPKIEARTFVNLKAEAKIGAPVLNRMIGLGRPEFRHITQNRP